MDNIVIQLLSGGGLILVGAYLVYYVTKRHNELEDFINTKLIQVIENNNRIMEQLVFVINEMRHEMKKEFEDVKSRLR